MTPFGYLILIVVGMIVISVYTEAAKHQEEVNRRSREVAEEQRKIAAEQERSLAQQRERERNDKLERDARERWRVHYQYRSLREIELMSGLDFEQFLAQLFAKIGYTNIRLTSLKDQGGDVICNSPSGVRTVIQAKRWSRRVGNKVVQEVLGAILHYDCQEGLVVTNNVFTVAAAELASKEGRIKLYNVFWLESMIKKHYAAEIPEFSWDAYKQAGIAGMPAVLEEAKGFNRRKYNPYRRRWR